MFMSVCAEKTPNLDWYKIYIKGVLVDQQTTLTIEFSIVLDD